MGKQKQQVISRFFAPKPRDPSSPPPLPPPPRLPDHYNPRPLQRKISTTVSFSPAKRKLLSGHLSASPSKVPKSSPSLHRRFVERLLEPPATNFPEESSQNPKKYTPLEQQVVELKSKYPDVVLMIEVGYRYRFFGEDAEIAARVLGIYAHVDHSFMTASVPTFRLIVHVRRLVSAGYKVGLVKQTETAAIKAHGSNRVGPFCRGLSALYTKATLEAAEEVGGGEEGFRTESSYLVCVVEKGLSLEDKSLGLDSGFDVRIGIVAVEISTGDVVHGEFNDNFMRSGLEAAILSLSPVELLLGRPLSRQTEKLLLAYAGPSPNVRVEYASRDCFRDGGALADIMSLYESIKVANLADDQDNLTKQVENAEQPLAIQAIMNMPDLAVEALALILHHFKQFGFERLVLLGASFRSLSNNTEMTLTANALQQLEVLKNNSDGSESGSLLCTVNHTLTIYGSRLLRHWVTHPLREKNMILARLDAVSEIAASMRSLGSSETIGGQDKGASSAAVVQPEISCLLSSVLTNLSKSPDIERGITRIFHRTATASEFIAVIQAILHAGKQLQRLHIDQDCNYNNGTVRSPLLRKLVLMASSVGVVGKAAKLLSAMSKEAADRGDSHNILITSGGQFPELDQARKAVQAAKEKLDSLIGVYRKELSIRNLEFLNVSGITHLVELPAEVKVPLDWVKVNSTKKTNRYHPPEVLSGLEELSLANEELAIASRTAWDSFLKGFCEHYAEFQATVQALAALDCLHGLATLARNKKYARPMFINDDEPVQIQLSGGRHPVLETLLQDSFVPNDTSLSAAEEYCQIITGPNMGGKSCYIRQVALIAIMAQVGSFVPATSAKLHVLDNIYTRMGASDSIQHGRSTFLEELSEASYIIRNCSSQSLVIIDELGRGTSTHDGVAIAYATLHYLLHHKKCMVLFVTHYPKLADISNEFPGSVGAYHVSYLTLQKRADVCDPEAADQDVTYLYKLVPGVCERSFGFKIAELAMIPSSCIRRAMSMSAQLEAEAKRREQNKIHIEQFMTLPGDHNPKYRWNHLDAPESVSADMGEFFGKLKRALLGGDPMKSFDLLKRAQRLSIELISK